MVDDFEIVPLGVAFSIQVVIKPKIILHIVNFGCFPKIAWFKSTVEDKHVVELRDLNRILGCFELFFKVEFRHMLVKLLVDILVEVSFSCLLGEWFLDYFVIFFLLEQNVGVDS